MYERCMNSVHVLWFFFSQKINEKPQIVNDYEGGRAIPNQQILAKIERALGQFSFLLSDVTESLNFNQSYRVIVLFSMFNVCL